MKFYQYNIQDLSDEKYIHYYSLMSEEKKRRVDRFRFEDDKKRTVVGEMLARRAISEWCGVPEENIAFGVAEHGKPYVEDLNIEFNISHSADMVVCVVNDNPVGVDIEKIRPVDLNTAKRIFSEEEITKCCNSIKPREEPLFFSPMVDYSLTVDTIEQYLEKRRLSDRPYIIDDLYDKKGNQI